MAGTGGVAKIVKKTPPHEVGIFFIHHTLDEVTTHHLSLIRKSNPAIPVIPVSGGTRKFDDGLLGMDLNWNDYCWWRHTRCGRKELAWEYSDLLLYGAYAKSQIRCKRWVSLEWDVKCTRRVEDVFKTVWNNDLVAANTFTYRQNRNWYWFEQYRKTVPNKMITSIAAATPFGVVMCSDRLLNMITTNVALVEKFHCQNEMRIGTFAKHFGMTAASCLWMQGKVSWHEDHIDILKTPGIYHPVKTIT